MFLEGPDLDVQPSGTLARSKTTINVVPNARERIMGTAAGADSSQPSSLQGNDPPAAAVIARANTAVGISRVGQAGLPIRALTVRKPGSNDISPASSSPKPSE
jgi:neutrophil factor 2